MHDLRVFTRLLSAVAMTALLMASLASAQTSPSAPAASKPVPAAAANPVPVPNDREVAETQTELIRLLRLSPRLTTVVSRDPSLLSDQEYVAHNNPQLAAFLAAHPEVARNPDFYLFTHMNRTGGDPDEALERAVWPDVYRSGPPQSPFGEFLTHDFGPLAAFRGLSHRTHLAGACVPGEPPLEPCLQAAKRGTREADRQVQLKPGTGVVYGDGIGQALPRGRADSGQHRAGAARTKCSCASSDALADSALCWCCSA